MGRADWDLNQGLNQRAGGASPFQLPSWDSGNQAQGDAYHIGRAPPGDSSAFGTCLCTVVFFQLPTWPPTKNTSTATPTSSLYTYAIHASTWTDLPSMPLTLPLTKAPALESRGSRLLRCRFGRTPCNAPSPLSGTRECLISSHIPSHPVPSHPSSPTHSPARISLHPPHMPAGTDVMPNSTKWSEIRMEGRGGKKKITRARAFGTRRVVPGSIGRLHSWVPGRPGRPGGSRLFYGLLPRSSLGRPQPSCSRCRPSWRGPWKMTTAEYRCRLHSGSWAANP